MLLRDHLGLTCGRRMKHLPSLERLAPDVSEPSLALYVSLVFILESWWKPRSMSKVTGFRMKVRLDHDVLYRLVQMQITVLVESAKGYQQKAVAERNFLIWPGT